MNLVKIKEIHNHTLYVDQDTLEFIIKKTYDMEALSILSSLKSLKNTLNIPQVHTFKQVDNQLVSYEQYISGETLSSYISNGRFITRRQFNEYAIQLTQTLTCLHEISIVHKDIKPDNLIICGEQIYLIDFNISRIYDADKSRDTKLLGTDGYASPEHFGYDQTTSKSDIFSLGRVFADLLSITYVEPQEYEEYNTLITEMTVLDPEYRSSLNHVQEQLLAYRKEYATDFQSSQIDDANVTKIRKFYPWQPLVYTSRGIVFDIAASLTLGTFGFSIVKDTIGESYPFTAIVFIITQVLTTIFLNHYLVAVSLPRFRTYRETKYQFLTVIKWSFVSFLDFLVFATAFIILIGVFEEIITFINSVKF
ncbi:protein kinase [Mollicutes bacterium LVI A0039]|nr:protein kinase [Mollicutes bacterium LVI A0039]